jgi:hypothetical protein
MSKELTPMSAKMAEIASAIGDLRSVASEMDAAKARVYAAVMEAVPEAQALDPDFQYLALGPGLAALEDVKSFATALNMHFQFDKLRRVLGLAKPPQTRGPGGGR